MPRSKLLFTVLLLGAACDGPRETGADAVLRQQAPPVASAPLTPRDIAAASFRSTVLLVMQDENGQGIGMGSGFVVAEGVVATNFHVIRGASRGTARVVGSDRAAQVTGVLASRPEVDLALLRVDDLTSPALVLRTELPPVGDPVFAVGNPQGLEGTFSSGIVSGIRQIDALDLLQITAPISPGSSGGPVLDENGAVVGVATATYRDGQNLNFAVPAKAVHEALSGMESPKPLRDASGPAQARSLASRFGDPAVDGVVADRFRWNTTNPYLDASFSFSLKNNLAEAIHNTVGLVIFHDRAGAPVDYVPFRSRDVIPPGLATRVHAQGDKSVKEMITDKDNVGIQFRPEPRTRVEIRVLTFEIIR